jgi:aliphatic nitrilase
LLTEPLDPQEEGPVFADIDLSAIDAAKNFLDPAGHYARPDVTQLLFDNRPRRAMIHIERSQSNNLTSNGCEQPQEPFHAADLEPTT